VTTLLETGSRPLAPEKDPSDRSILIGVIATVVFHVLLVVLSPKFAFDDFSGVHTRINIQSKQQGQSFDFQLSDPVQEEKPRNPFQYVETNPDAPANEPDKTDNFSNRNQQAAQQEKPTELDPEKRPTITNAQDKIKSDSIVTGDMAPPQLGAAPLPESEAKDQEERKEQKQRMAQSPLSGFDKTEGKDENGVASNISDAKTPSNRAEQKLEGAPDSQEADGALAAIEAAHRAQPKARQRLTANRTTVLTNRAAGVNNVGVVGRDARWSEYGEYLAELVEIVQIQWYSILQESRVSPPHGSHVVITFKINSKGETDIVKVEDADAGKQGVFSCQNAIQARQPYRKWTDQMIAVLGEEQTLTFSFYYQ